MVNTPKPNTRLNNLLAIFLLLSIMCISVFILIYAKNILKPLAVGALFAMILLPIKNRYEKVIKFPALASFLSLLTVIIPMSLLVGILTRQINIVLQDIPSLIKLFKNSIEKLNLWLSKTFHWRINANIDIGEQLDGNTSSILTFLGSGISLSGTILVLFFLTLICAFFFLWYSKSVKEFIVIQFKPGSREKVFQTISRLKSMLVKYISGLMYVSLIMAGLSTQIFNTNSLNLSSRAAL